MFVFDLTGSMGGFREILNTRHKVRRCLTFGLSLLLLPYNLDRPLTYDTALVRSTINSLYIRYGGDGPEDYARVLWEMLNDPAIGWRSSCAKFVIFWLDNIPHACDLYNPSRPYSAYTGTDPGRDAIAGT
jgi:hypothetical protein